jgi:signal peptidase I
MGHAYAGFPVRGFAIAAALYLTGYPLLGVLLTRATLLSLAAGFAGLAAVTILIAIDSARVSRHPRTRYLARGAVFLVCVAFAVASIPLSMVWEWWRYRTLPASYYAPSGAMVPTILVGDHLYVDSRGYQPEHGDVVVFRLARAENGDLASCSENPELSCEGFIKRIVGLPGDTVRFDGAALVLNGELRTGASDLEAPIDVDGLATAMRRESLGAHDYRIGDFVHGAARGSAEVTVEPGRYFLAGDNRDNSNDSRNWGTIPRADIVGRATKIYWSWNNRVSWLGMANPRTLWRLLREETRWDRIGMEIE